MEIIESPDVIYVKNLMKIAYDEKLITYKEYLKAIENTEKNLAIMLEHK